MRILSESDILEYLEEIGVDPPKSVDYRQKIISAVVCQVMTEEVEKIQSVISPGENIGFSASSVDLGFLQSLAIELCALDRRNFNKRFFYRLLVALVQRVKVFNIDVEKVHSQVRYEVGFTTKDDYGWYDYKFTIDLTDIEQRRKQIDINR